MDTQVHSMSTLFEQLGLDSSEQGIERFVVSADPIPSSMALWEAPMWTESQARTLKQMKDEDADWAVIVDELDVMLR
ncbi:DUF2789 domain-containing protein [Marinomonas ostreistagni]|uniref:DUF2789 domain-containing protein n=1 Tax=Marinomonas ostreistagni TaxID=359209 RepID=UPI0019523575|nr:DUF2789 domain-containing protein [Marinomonas ostreistagni]MBM6549524.1 DUF2789 domain-containing protein [Marinomonas ostreistagni]